jgi:RecA-family ATPase
MSRPAWLEEDEREEDYSPFKNDEKIVPLGKLTRPAPHPDAPLRTYCAADLDGKTIPEREWLVEGVMPHRTVTLLSGDGGIGKSLLVLNLFAHIAARRDWLGFKTMQGPVLYVGAEDEQDEIERRIESMRQGLGVQWGEFCDLHYMSLAGEDALLGLFDRAENKMMPTRLFERVQDRVHNLGAIALAVDTRADVFGGDEVNRNQVRQFIGILRRLSIKENATTILLEHPSVAGMSSGSGTSGSTGWNNSARSRVYFEADDKDKNARVLKFMKSNYGPKGEPMRLIYRDGLFVPESMAEVQTRASNAETVFLQLLDAYNNEGRNVVASRFGNYAPSAFAKDKRTKGISKQALIDAMNGLFERGVIVSETYGPPSKQRSRLVRK